MTIKSHVVVTVMDGILKPDVPLNLPEGTRAVIDIHSEAEQDRSARLQAAEEFFAFADELDVDTGETKFRRDTLYDRG
jgi:predicted DNA-binding antitoxin AbrB/MazE fold protein